MIGNQYAYDLKDLFAAIATDNERAFAILFDQYQRRVFSIAYKMTRKVDLAEDISQNFFLSLWKNRTMLDTVAYPGAYMHRAIYNMALKYLRQKGNEARYRQLVQLEARQYCNETQETLDVRQLQELVVKAAAGLPRLKQEVFKLRYSERLDYDDISRMLHITDSTARSYFRDALKHVRNYMLRLQLPDAELVTAVMILLKMTW